MNKETSVYLDAARFLAALAVMLCHIDDFIVKGVFPFIDHIGVESVGVFFVLSGFVIGYATEFRETDLRTYATNRAARLYSVVIPCLTLTLLLDTLGKHVFPAIYYGRESFLREAAHIAFSFSFLNYSWLLPHPVLPGNNGPFWSLCFEAPYYVVFGLAFYLRGFKRWLAAVAVLLVAGPAIAGFFPMWLAGFGVYKLCRKITLKPWAARAVFLSSVLLWICFEWLLKHFNICPSVPAIVRAGPILLYGSAICFGLSIIGFRFCEITLGASLLARIGRPISWLAGATFTLYLLHFPLAWLLGGALAASPWHAWPAPLRWALLAGVTPGIGLLTAQVTERKKHAWRRLIEILLQGAGWPVRPGATGLESG